MELSRVHHSVHSSESPADESSNIAKLEQHAVESTVMDLTPIDSLTEASKIKIYHALIHFLILLFRGLRFLHYKAAR